MRLDLSPAASRQKDPKCSHMPCTFRPSNKAPDYLPLITHSTLTARAGCQACYCRQTLQPTAATAQHNRGALRYDIIPRCPLVLLLLLLPLRLLCEVALLVQEMVAPRRRQPP